MRRGGSRRRFRRAQAAGLRERLRRGGRCSLARATGTVLRGVRKAAPACRWRLVTLPSLDGEPVEDVANSIFRKWGIGQKGKNDGILLLLAIAEHKSRLEIGYGLEPILPMAWRAIFCAPCGRTFAAEPLRRRDAGGGRRHRHPHSPMRATFPQRRLRHSPDNGAQAAREFHSAFSWEASSCSSCFPA